MSFQIVRENLLSSLYVKTDDTKIAIGSQAGVFNQGLNSIAIGNQAGTISQSNNSIAIGNNSGNTGQSIFGTIAIGQNTGNNLVNAGFSTLDAGPISIGYNAGFTGQKNCAIAIGQNAGQNDQGYKAISIGHNSSIFSQGERAIALGSQAGQSNQGSFGVAVGVDCGRIFQGTRSISVGFNSGQSTQGTDSIAIGYRAGRTMQSNKAIAIGLEAGQGTQGENAISIGNTAGRTAQGANAIAIGNSAGALTQGANAIAIGNLAGASTQAANSIILNASGSDLPATQSAFYVQPIRTTAISGVPLLSWDSSSKEVYLTTSKTFVIDHPLDQDKYLVHACLEGPEAGVYYRGKSEIVNDEFVDIVLPSYTNSFTDFTVQLTPQSKNNLYYSDVENGSFRVYGQNGKFSWLVHALRQNIDVEPLKSETIVSGDGPYKYIL